MIARDSQRETARMGSERETERQRDRQTWRDRERKVERLKDRELEKGDGEIERDREIER